MKPIVFAVKKMFFEDLIDLKEDYNDLKNREDVDKAFMQDLTFVAVFGIDDPI